MVYEKTFLGENRFENKVIRYYAICKNNCYGVEIEEQKAYQSVCDFTYFTTSQSEANKVGNMLFKHAVTLVTFTDILDDYVA